MTFIFGYQVVVLTRMVWSVLALALGAVIGKYRPTNFTNIVICLFTFLGCVSWFLIYIVALTELF